MPSPSLLLDWLRISSLSNESASSEMPVLSESLASLSSIRLPAELLRLMPLLFVRRSLPLLSVARANSIAPPLSLARLTPFSTSWLRSDSMFSTPPLSSIRLRSTRLSLDCTSTGGVCVTSSTTPPLFISMSLSATTLLPEPSSATPAPLEPVISLCSTRLKCERSSQTASSAVEANKLSSIRFASALPVSQTPRLFPITVLPRMMFSRTPESADGNGSGGSVGRFGSGSAMWPSANAASCVISGRRFSITLRRVPVLSATPQSQSTMRPFLIVTLSKPMLRMAAPTPLPSSVWPSRSIVIPSAATTRPSHRQSTMSLRTRMLCVTFMPQWMKVGTGAALIVQSYSAGVRSSLPARSTARTSRILLPGGRPVSSYGDVQSVNAACVVSLHSNVASGSSLENVNVALVCTVVRSGPESIVVSGASMSGGGGLIAHVIAAGPGSALPWRSIARTWNVCDPTARSSYVVGVVQAAHAPASGPGGSSLHSNVRSGPKVMSSLPAQRKTAVVFVVTPGGPGAIPLP